MGRQELTFEGENPNEKMLFILRRHPWTLANTGVVIVVLLWVMTYVFMKYQGSWVTSWALFLIAPVILYLAFRAWFLWNNSVYVLTSDRLICVDQLGWFRRTVTEINLGDILKISHDIKGPAATMFNYGNVDISASGATETDLSLAAVYDPYDVQQQIVRAKRDSQK